MKAHRFDMGRPACGTPDGVNAADMDPPEVTCRRCPKVDFSPFDARHYARKGGRTFIVDGFAPDPMRPWAAVYEGARRPSPPSSERESSREHKMTDLTLLKQRALEATPGEWRDVPNTGCVFADGRTVAQCYWVSGSDQDPDANAAFIAAANPQAILALLADMEALKAGRDEAIKLVTQYAREAGEATGRLEMSEAPGVVDGWRERAEAAEARATALEAENGWLFTCDDGWEWSANHPIESGENVYATNVRQATNAELVARLKELSEAHNEALSSEAKAHARATALEERVREAAEKLQKQIPITRACLTDNGINPNFADVLLSHYGDVARALLTESKAHV